MNNLPIICLLPTTGVSVTPQPISLVYTHAGSGHYDSAVPLEADISERKKRNVTRCTCGHSAALKGTPCTSARCTCHRQQVGCSKACICKSCGNDYGLRPPPATTRRRETYKTQQQPLKGRPGREFLATRGEVESEGKLTVMESLLFKSIITHFIWHGVNVTPENVQYAYNVIRKICNYVQ